jgi:hypothetical protein
VGSGLTQGDSLGGAPQPSVGSTSTITTANLVRDGMPHKPTVPKRREGLSPAASKLWVFHQTISPIPTVQVKTFRFPNHDSYVNEPFSLPPPPAAALWNLWPGSVLHPASCFLRLQFKQAQAGACQAPGQARPGLAWLASQVPWNWCNG